MYRPLRAVLAAQLLAAVVLTGCDKLGSGTPPKPSTDAPRAASSPP